MTMGRKSRSAAARRLLAAAAAVLLLLIAGTPLGAADDPEPQKQKKEGGKKAGGSKKKKKDKDASAAKSSTGEEKDAGDAKASKRGFRFVMKDNPSFRFGKVARIDFHLKSQVDFRDYDPYVLTKEGDFDVHRFRPGIEGNVFKHFEFEIEHEVRDVFRNLYTDVEEEGLTTQNPWRDVYVNFRYFKDAQIKIGKFKMPFGMEETTPSFKLDFVYRSRISDTLAPAREKGIMVHGRLFERGFSYEFGYFREDGENARTFDNQGTGRHAFAGRVTGRPFRLLPVPEVFKSAEFGTNFVHSELPDGLYGLRGRSVSKATIFNYYFVNGSRLRLGADLSWQPGPFSLKGEFISLSDERTGQGRFGEDLPDMLGRGWYASAGWVVTGERTAGGIQPRKELLRGWGFGAVEIAARYEQLRFGSAEHPGRPSRSVRAANVLGNSDRLWTFGVNWYVNRWVKIQGNFIRERFEDDFRSPIPGQSLFWSRIVRLQFVM
jgi:phosphate-selective porin OprO/OprP